MRIRYHLDESVRNAVAIGVRQRGIDVTTSGDAGLIGASDEQQMEFARSEGRVIVSHDRDFLRLAAAGHAHAGVVFSRQQSRSIGQIVLGLVRLWRRETAEHMRQRVEYL